ncbi:MAG TPA: hypothetical protein VNO30_21100 [Kofleriaceae bacterium]|nr:hypothetical protein [Kofleriaceae bacterium]
MEEYADIYYVDARNATRDHRPGNRPVAWAQPRLPATQTVYASPTRPPVYNQPAPVYNQTAYPGAVYAQAPQVMYPVPQSPLTALLGRLTPGQLIEMAAQIFAALQSLPAAPVATQDTSTDVSNLVTYQSALAQHAKRDEQVRTLGSLVARLLG